MEQSRFQIFLKYVAPAFASLFLLGAIANSYITTLSLDKLTGATGKVEAIGIQKIYGAKYNRHPLNIQLENKSIFTLREAYKDHFESIQKNISIGDEITIYHHNLSLYTMVIGASDEILEIDKEGKIIFSFELIKNNSKVNCILMFSVSAILWLIYYFFHIRKHRNKTVS